MKTTIGILVVAAFLSATAFPSVAEAAPVGPSVNPSTAGEDASTAISPRGQEKHYQEMTAKAEQLSHDAAVDLHAGRYVQAESEARQLLALIPGDGVPAEVFAESLKRQGKDQEALQAYATLVEHYDRQPRSLLPYAQFLLKSGQWAQAATVYN